MKLQGRNLTNGTQGDDVRLLHHELQLLGFRLIPGDEVRTGIFGPHTLVAVREFQQKAGLKVTGIVEEATARAINARVEGTSGGEATKGPFSVHGRVTTVTGEPKVGAIARVYDRDLRNEELLGKTTTDAAGLYEVRYGPETFRRPEKGNADVVVKVCTTDDKPLATSPVLFNAPPDATVDIVIPAEVLPPPTLFEAIGTAVQPVLEGLRVADLEENPQNQDLAFLAGETGFDRSLLARFAVAHKLAQPALPAEFWFVLLGGSLFQYTATRSLAEQTTEVLDSLPSLDADAVRKALTRGLNQGEIPPSFQQMVGRWIEAFLAFAASRLVSGTGRPTFVSSALDDAGITDPQKQATFARLFHQHNGLTPELLAALDDDPSFTKEEVADLQTTFQLGDLTKADFSVVKMLKEELPTRQTKDIRKLARKSESEWVDLVTAKHAAGAIELPLEIGEVAGQAIVPNAQVYGKTLERRFREAFPTTAFSGGLERALSSGSVRGLRHAAELGRFLERHEDFEFLTTRLDTIEELGKDDSLAQEAAAVQRVFKLAPAFEAVDTLLADNVHSAQQAYRLGKNEFVERYANRPGFTAESAQRTWNQAASVHASALTVVADLQALDPEGLPAALSNGNQALDSFPNWKNLFRGGDLCECEHCRSVLGPAAYFTDLLMFLRDRRAKNPAFTVKDIVFRRRPDLGYLELNCANALTPLPYIDVVCEVLEDVIAAGDNDIELAGFTAMPADPVDARDAVADRLPLSGDWTLSQVSPSDPDRWVVHGDEATWLLKKKGTADFFAEILRNTKASAEELRAYSQYVNPKAYEKLRAARYPITLPFDLFAEEVRAAFRKVNLQRWDLMRTFQGPAAPNNPTEGDVAAEFFGISTDSAAPFDEKRLILDDDPTDAGQQVLWGEAPGGWLDEVGRVDHFLRKSGLEYEELLALLDLKFINPAGDIAVHHLGDSCDTAQKVIQVLDAAKLDRIHRFLRLWRKLDGWQMWELDLAIRHPRLGAGALDEPFLVNLFHFSEVRTRLGGKMTVEQALALFGGLNTKTRFTELHEKRADGLYQQTFLNRRLIHPLDLAFEVAAVKVPGPTSEKISTHRPVVLAALGIREADLVLLQGLTKASDGTPYITDDLTLRNLSFLWRHARLSKLLKLKAEDWRTVLKILQQDLFVFASPKAALDFLETIEHLKATDFTPDALNWLLAADRSAKAATKEADAARFLLALRQTLQAIQKENDPAQYPFLQAPSPTDVDPLTTLLTASLLKLNQDKPATELFLATLRGNAIHETPIAGLDTVAFPAGISILYDPGTQTLRFTGVMTGAERTTLLSDPGIPAAILGDVGYQAAIAELFASSRAALDWLLQESDLSFPLADHVPNNLAVAASKALALLASTLAENTVVQQASDELDLAPGVARVLLTGYDLLPETLLEHLTVTFAATTGAVDSTTLKTTFDAWFWANRVATLWKRWQLDLADLEQIIALTSGAQLLDFLTLPLDDTGTIASFEQLSRTSRLLKFRESLPETGITWLEVLEKLSTGAYTTVVNNVAVLDAAPFAADVERLNDGWLSAEVGQLVAALGLTVPGYFLLAETWEHLRRAFYFLDSLNASASTVKTFAAATMNETHAKTVEELLRSKFGTETWLTVSAEIQDVLRERKRDALAAYLLTWLKPADAPTGKWEDTNDLYAYYLLDVEMSACQLTSRLVQASGSLQLFVLRCFMGLEPDVEVKAGGPTGDSAWRWWSWMRKYRVWEANRKVFLWTENWLEPELRKDKSPFFRDLETQLQQNEINQENAEAAFTSYLDKLGGVAQLEIAGFYQEDDGDDAILHVFGRTTGAEPHLYYYRRYDYHEWTAWEEVKLDIHGDYLIPMVVNKRLFLFWPVFTESPDEGSNRKVPTPAASSSADVPETSKLLKLQLAVSEYRRGTWTPKKVSTDFYESGSYTGEITRHRYTFWGIDRGEVDGRFGIQVNGHGEAKFPQERSELQRAAVSGGFELTGCKGVLELALQPLGGFTHALRVEPASAGGLTVDSKWVELRNRTDAPDEDFTLASDSSLLKGSTLTPVLMQTPGIFKMSPPWHLSYLDRLGLDGSLVRALLANRDLIPAGTWLPFFYNDQKRTFCALPTLTLENQRRYYPEIKKTFRELEDFIEGQVLTSLEELDLSTMPSEVRQTIEQTVSSQFPEMPPPPYTDAHLKSLMKRWAMRFAHSYLSSLSLIFFERRQFHFKNFYHPFVCDFARLVYDPLQGIPALMSRETQLRDSGFRFKQVYQPTFWVVQPETEDFYPREVVDFTSEGAYASYNWELFFHIPLLIANSLSKNQRFEEARDWYHFIFNPLGLESATPGGSPMSKYWITKPFFETTDPQYVQQRIENILRMLTGDTSVPGASAQLKKDLEDQVRDWRTHPFEPHRIATYRTVAYQKAVVMKYLDNLIAWGDFLFRQDSIESINEATQLYVLAANILGPRPLKIPPRVKPPEETFNELENQLDDFSNALVQVENLIPPQSGNTQAGADPAPLPTLYFCIPHNEKMLGYWDTVADRLFKIRHCMNIEGVVRQLALFEAPIDPGALVKAVAAGVDIGAALADLNAPLPLYRFNVFLQRANEVCNDVKALGGALLSALEKRDAEALALLRQSQEIHLLKAVKAVREEQVEEARENLESLKRSKIVVELRRDYYRDIERIIAGEQLSLDKLATAHAHQNKAQAINIAASILGFLPNVTIGVSGFGGSPHVNVQWGTGNIISALQAASGAEIQLSNIASYEANRASTVAGYDRRFSEWKHQERLAEKELPQLDKQIAAAELRIAIAEKELENHVLQIENAKATDAFMRSKYTNQELYQWQVGQISGVYFQSYNLAYDLAKRAERCFRFELGLEDSSFIQFGYWDSLKKGLMAGEKLQYDLRRLEIAYLEQNRREFELTKPVSLALLDPLALVKLRETGRCFLSLPEEIFDLDYPGHYFRRLKSVSLTLPCVAGPYTTIACTLRLLKNSIRINTANGDNGYPHNTDDQGVPADDSRFVENNIPVKAIAASSAQNDSGVFELSFRDERYLPFEGAGAISEWSLELFNDAGSPDFGKPLRQLDYSTITDAVLHVKYTAREDAGPFKKSAIDHLRDHFGGDGTTPSLRLFDLRREFPTPWHRFLHPADPAQGNVFELEMSPDLFLLRDLRQTLKVNQIWLVARCTGSGNYEVVIDPPLPAPSDPNKPDPRVLKLASSSAFGDLFSDHKPVSALDVQILPDPPPVGWRLKMTRNGSLLAPTEVEDLYLVLGYQWE